jgi:hypothetical protein
MSATRIGLVMKRFARQVQTGPNLDAQGTMPRCAKGTPNHPGGSFDLFTGR